MQLLLLTAGLGLLSVLGAQAPQLIPASAEDVRDAGRDRGGTRVSEVLALDIVRALVLIL